MASSHSLRLVVIAPDLLAADEADVAVQALFERSRQLHIGLLQGGFKLMGDFAARFSSSASSAWRWNMR